MLTDCDRAREYLKKEYNEVAQAHGDLYEQISEDVCRVNLSAWKAENLPAEWLMRLFAASCNTAGNGKLDEYLRIAEEILARSNAGFAMREWEAYLNEYKKAGMPAVHHSEQYREYEKPAYRIVNSRFCRIFPIIIKAKDYQDKDKPCVIAVDGRAASGKTTLAKDLQIALDADVIHTDDFFVPPALRSETRFETPGENIHHERFAEEVLPFISGREPFSYRIFDCGKADFNGKREIGSKQFRIVEGAYSCHPKFGNYADITVFSDVSADEQTERIRRRNGEEMLGMFLNKWIPMEEEYFLHFGIKNKTNLIVRKDDFHEKTERSY